jgi:anti-repressor protein
MIDARSLHGWLNVRQRFNDWLRERLAQYGFEEGEDFYCLSSKTGGRPRKDCLLTLDMAKELAMVERTDVGRETRRYFIRMERAALPISQDHG